MALVLNSGLTAGTTGLWWFAQDRQNLGSAVTGDALLNGSTYASGLVTHDATADYTTLASSPALLLPTTEVTIMLGLRCTDTTLRSNSCIGLESATNTDRAGAHVPYSDGIVYWDFGGNTAGVSRLTVAWTKDTSAHVWAFTSGPRGMEIWLDQVKIASNAATPVRTNGGYFALGKHGSGGISDLYEYDWVFVHSTQLSEAEIAAISADPEGELTETAVFSGTPFEPAHWHYRGAVMPVRSTSEVPANNWVQFGSYTYISYAGEYQNQSTGYPQATNVRTGCIVRTTDGGTWETAFDGNAGLFSRPHWQPRQLFVIGTTLYALIFSGGVNFIAANAYIAAGELALMSTTDGTSWSFVHSFHSWATQNNGTAPVNVAVEVLGAYWHARRSSAGGDDWIIASWSVRCDGSTGSFFEAATQRLRSSDEGATWTYVADMKGIAPFTGNPNSLDGPYAVVPIWRSAVLGDRWFMFGGSGTMNWSDDEGTTWTSTIWFGLSPSWTYPLASGGLVIFSNGTGVSAPDVKVSCDLGVTTTIVPSGDSYQGSTPANAFVATAQFPYSETLAEGNEELLAIMKDGGGVTTSIWWTDTGGELWTELGTLATVYTVPTFLARLPSNRMLLYTATTAPAGGPQVWTCDDEPTGVAGTRTICTGLTAIRELAGLRSWAWVS